MPNGDKPKSKKSYIKTTKSGGSAETSVKAVSDARAGKGAFKDPSSYKGKEVKGKSGKLAGIVTQAGGYMRATGPVQRRAAAKKLAYDKAVHKADSTARAQRNTRFKTAKLKPNS